MPITFNGNGTVTGLAGLAVGGLPDGTVDADTLAANAVTSGKLAKWSSRYNFYKLFKQLKQIFHHSVV